MRKSIFRFLLIPRRQLKFMVIFLFANSVLFLNSSISFSAANSLICLFEVHNNFFFYDTFLVMYNILFRLEKEGY